MNASFVPNAQRAVRGSTRSRLLRPMVVIAVVLMVSVLPTMARADSSERPTIVLVHGAWASSEGWDMVVAGLQKDGYRTATPTLGLLSIAEDVAIVRAALDNILGPKILVAHSYGGFVISNAASGRSDVLGLVFTAAFVPDQGDSIFSLGAGFHTSEAFNHFIWTGTPFASPAFIDPAFFAQFFCQDLNPNLEATLNAEQIPLNFSIALTPSGPVAWHTLPSWYAISGKDLMIDPAEELFMAQRAGATTIVFPAASHAGGITHYATGFVKLIEEAVQQTAD
ncbi:MAG: alpha/beta hydrolase [Methanobacteriota archaeon]|nr:MAG: alpha/beta hydrolase [Euryarchaeota archaeon]